MKAKNVRMLSLAISFILTVSFVSMGTGYTANWTVGDGMDYSTIQSAIDNVNTLDDDVIIVNDGIYSEDIVVNKRLTILANGSNVEINPTYTGFTVINNINGDGSGTLIKEFTIINSPLGIGMNITVNNCKIENLLIDGGLIGILTTGNNTTISENVISNVLNSSIQVGEIAIINSSDNISITSNIPNNCRIESNQINGGTTGISAFCDNSTIINNIISGTSGYGIAVVGSNPTISGNQIMDMVSDGKKIGITVAALNLSGTTGLIINNNTLSNIQSTNDTTLGIDAFAMSMNSTLDNILICDNTIFNITGFGKASALSIVGLSLGDISSIKVFENNISHVYCQGVNSTSLGIEFVALTISDTKNESTSSQNLTIYNNNITNLNSQGTNSTITGISYFALSKGNASISQNILSNFNADFIANGIAAAAVDISGNQTGNVSHLILENNTISDITAINITSGIQAIVLGDIDVMHNSVFRLNSAKTKYIITQNLFGVNKAIIRGNNLEGNGIGEGIAVRGNNTTINYNRIVNFQHYIQNINSTELVEFIKGSYPSDDELRDYFRSQNLTEEEIDNLIEQIHQAQEAEDLIPSNTSAPYNYYGTNNPESNKFLPGPGTLIYSPWLVLNIRADPSIINVGQTYKITADVYSDSAGGDHRSNAVQFFSGPQVTFTTNLDNVESNSITVPWTNGLATVTLRADEGAGIATVTATDYQTVKTSVTILGSSNVVNAGIKTGEIQLGCKTVGMQETGLPIPLLILAILMILGVLVTPKRK